MRNISCRSGRYFLTFFTIRTKPSYLTSCIGLPGLFTTHIPRPLLSVLYFVYGSYYCYTGRKEKESKSAQTEIRGNVFHNIRWEFIRRVRLISLQTRSGAVH